MSDEENNKVDTTIKDALEYYDINCDKYNNFLNKIKLIIKQMELFF